MGALDPKNRRNLFLRVASAAVLFPLAVWLTVLGGKPFALLAAVGAAVAAGELILMFGTVGVGERTFAKYLYVPELADADLVWRTSGEQRLSNFMLWQAAYAELIFLDVLWPDFDKSALEAAIDVYRRRERRFGGSDPDPR